MTRLVFTKTLHFSTMVECTVEVNHWISKHTQRNCWCSYR